MQQEITRMRDWDPELAEDDRSKAIVEHESGILVCLAGPGTGKTWSLLHRIVDLERKRHVLASQIQYVTFIREIEAQFRNDFKTKDFTKHLPEPRINTLHSIAFQVLMKRRKQAGKKGDLYPLDVASEKSDDSILIRRDLLSLVRLDNPGSQVDDTGLKSALRAQKERWTGLNAAFVPDQRVISSFKKLRRAYQCIDWDELIPRAEEGLLRLLPDTNPLIGTRHFLIDEYQDFNPAEQRFLRLISQRAESVVIVGDQFQSIYSGRGARPKAIVDLFDAGGDARVSMNSCRRCKRAIVSAANKFGRQLGSRFRELTPINEGGRIRCCEFISLNREIEFLARVLIQISKDTSGDAEPEERTVCLFPDNTSLKFYFRKLSDEGVPCHNASVHSGERRWLALGLRFLHQPAHPFLQRMLIERWVKLSKPWTEKILTELVSTTSAFDEVVEGTIHQANSSKTKQSLLSWLETIRALANGSLDSRIAALSTLACRPVSDAVVRKFLQAVGDIKIEEAIKNACDEVFPETADEAVNPRHIVFLTMHGSKGLTRRCVVLPGLENGVLPGTASGDRLQELKRLFFVALTRATDEVVITYPTSRGRGDPLWYKSKGQPTRSQFIDDAGLNCICPDP